MHLPCSCQLRLRSEKIWVQVRLLDASTAESVRQRARQAGAGNALVNRLVPTHAADQQTAQRANLLWGSLQRQLANAGFPAAPLPVSFDSLLSSIGHH